jgi:hypothetical protein
LLVSNDEQGSIATDVAVNGNDVYVSGYRYINDRKEACYWKNGIRHELEGNNVDSETYALAVKGNDVYVIGKAVSDFCWKNGTKTNLIPSAPSSWSASDIAIQGDDIYISGTQYAGGYYKAVYAENGVVIDLPYPVNNVSINSIANAISVSGNDIYATGYVYQNGFDQIAVYWKNGIMMPLDNSAAGHDIYVDGKDVYVAGEKLIFYGPGNYRGSDAVYWKNGVATKINNSTVITYSRLLSIAVNQGDIYTIGMTDSQNTFYKNGTKQNFSGVLGMPMKVLVVPKKISKSHPLVSFPL